MKIEVTLAGSNISEKWQTAKIACRLAIANAASRCAEVALAHEQVCGQRQWDFKVPPGERFSEVYFHRGFNHNNDVFQLNHGAVIGGYGAYDNVHHLVTEHWACALQDVVEFTVALNCWTPTIPEE